MSKKKKLTPGGPPKGKIIVNSNTWGTHERFARGTHKPAPVNDAFKKASSTLHQANHYAGLINSAIKPFNRNIKDGTLWSRLTKHFYPFVESKTPVDYKSLVTLYRPEGDEHPPRIDKNGKVIDLDVPIHKHHRLTHTLRFNDLELTKDPDNTQLHISIKGLQINFTNAIPDIDGAHLTMIALYVDDQNEFVETRHQAAMLELKETEVYFELPIPPNTGVVLLCLKCEAYHNGGLSGNLRTKGMDFIKVEALNDIAVTKPATPDVEDESGSAGAPVEVASVASEVTPAGTDVISALNEYGTGTTEVISAEDESGSIETNVITAIDEFGSGQADDTAVENESIDVISSINEYGTGASEVTSDENESNAAGTDVVTAINEYGTGVPEITSAENESGAEGTDVITALNEYGTGATDVIPVAGEDTAVSTENASDVAEGVPVEAAPVVKKTPRVPKAKGPDKVSIDTKRTDESKEQAEEPKSQLSLW